MILFVVVMETAKMRHFIVRWFPLLIYMDIIIACVIAKKLEWRGILVHASDFQNQGRGFDAQSRHVHVNTSARHFAPIYCSLPNTWCTLKRCIQTHNFRAFCISGLKVLMSNKMLAVVHILFFPLNYLFAFFTTVFIVPFFVLKRMQQSQNHRELRTVLKFNKILAGVFNTIYRRMYVILYEMMNV